MESGAVIKGAAVSSDGYSEGPRAMMTMVKAEEEEEEVATVLGQWSRPHSIPKLQVIE